MRHVRYTHITPFDFNGLRIAELTPEGLDIASVAEISVPPGIQHDRARSTKCDKLYVCVEGEVSFNVGNESAKLVPTDVLSIRKNEWFDYRNDGQVAARLLLIHIPPFDLECEHFLAEKDRLR